MNVLRAICGITVVVVAVMVAPAANAGDPPKVHTTVASVSSSGELAEGNTSDLVLSTTGRYVAFTSLSRNLVTVENDSSCYRKDLRTGEVITVGSGNREQDWCDVLDMTGDARYIVYATRAPLVDTDTEGWMDVYREEVATGAVDRISATNSGAGTDRGDCGVPASISSDGRWVGFDCSIDLWQQSETDFRFLTYLKDVQTGELHLVASSVDGEPANSDSWLCEVSANGDKVLFGSTADNLVPGDTNNQRDVFLKDMTTGAITRVSTQADGSQMENSPNGGMYCASMSADQRFLFFSQPRGYLTDDPAAGYFRKNTATGALVRVSARANGANFKLADVRGFDVSDSGRYATFSVYQDIGSVVFRKDIRTGDVVKMSVFPDPPYGLAAWPSISGNGVRVGFNSPDWSDPPTTWQAIIAGARLF